jgi:hypothetical protein
MARFLSIFTIAFMLANLTAGGIGIAIAKHARVADLPEEAVYEIRVDTGDWPDRYYAVTYEAPEPRSFGIENYWTLEPSKYPLSPPVWTYHLGARVFKDVSYTVVPVSRN